MRLPEVRRDKIIIGVLVVMTAAVLLSRGRPGAGFALSMAGLALLFLSGIKEAAAGLARYRRLAPLDRAWVALQAIQLILIIDSAVAHRVAYFPVLLVLGAEYFIWDSKSRR